jgi:hypothetical protein
MTPQTGFHADKPTLTTHPVNGGDALMFTITPSPPPWWWRAMRHHAGSDPVLARPWDQEHESRIAVVCPSLDTLADVIEGINAAVEASNRDYAQELALQRDSAAQLRTDQAQRDQYLTDIQNALDAHYDRHDAAVA